VFKDWLVVRRLGVAGSVLIVIAALALAACGGGGEASLKPNATATTATTIVNQQGGDGNGGTSGGAATTGAGAPHGTTTSAPHGTTTSSPAATTTTIHNTINPILSKIPPSFFYATGEISCPDCEKLPSGTEVGVCHGTPPSTAISVSWQARDADYVQLNRGGATYPIGDRVVISAPCSDRYASVELIAFGSGGETSDTVTIYVDPHYRP